MEMLYFLDIPPLFIDTLWLGKVVTLVKAGKAAANFCIASSREQ